MKYFGTDGIRGKAEMFSDELLKKVAVALIKSSERGTFFIGRDCRVSGCDIAVRLAKYLVRYGGKVSVAGIMPTPECAFLTRELGFEWGIMITASHNPPEYNGIKIFDGLGAKLCGEKEERLDALIADGASARSGNGKLSFMGSMSDVYLKAIEEYASADLKGMRIMLDCACGAMSEVALEAFRAVGADVSSINAEYDGERINVDCGATCVDKLLCAMQGGEWDLGFAFDGDGDRVIAVKDGKIYDGDHIMYLLAKSAKEKGELNGRGVAMTILGNYGVEEAFGKRGINVSRCDVGDKNLADMIVKNKLALGSEEGGHVIVPDFLPTGDGLLTAMLLAALAKKEDIAAMDDIVDYPKFCSDVIVDKKSGLSAIESFEKTGLKAEFAKSGVRLVLRMSGTENKLRVMTEGSNSFAAKVASDAATAMLKLLIIE